jgi:hypothetical protein
VQIAPILATNGLIEVRRDQDTDVGLNVTNMSNTANANARIDLTAGRSDYTSRLTLVKFPQANTQKLGGSGLPLADMSVLLDNSMPGAGAGLALMTSGGPGGGSPIVFAPNGNEAMRLDGSGNVGIGTTTLSAALSVVRSGSEIAGFFGNSSNDPNIPTVEVLNGGGSGAGLLVRVGDASGSGHAFEVTDYTGATALLDVLDNGQVKIPTSLTLAGNSCAGVCTSDARLKHDITDISTADALDKVSRLRAVTYRWNEPEKHGGYAGTVSGFVAQDVEAVFPEWVGEDKQGYKTLNTGALPPTLVAAVRELHAENESLKATNRDLDARVRALEDGRSARHARFFGDPRDFAFAAVGVVGLVVGVSRRRKRDA